ncbi:MAG: Hsp20/alpha crystallin family protein [Pirellulales bacterium]|nr:Hsp20/alpha crystallin family protein [Pirellulales bacterium]
MFGTLIPRRESAAFDRLEREMHGLVDRFFGGDGGWLVPTTQFMPNMNIAESETAFEVTTELPGLKPEEFQVEFKNGELWIVGESKEEKEERGKTWHRVERRHGEFRRVVPLPETVNPDKAEATYRDGVLKVTVPKSEKAQPKHVPIKIEATPPKG